MILHTSVPALARLLLRAQADLNGLMDALPPAARAAAHPLLNLQMGHARFKVSSSSGSNANLQLTCAQDGLEYRFSLNNGLPSALLLNRVTGRAQHLEGAAVYEGAVPDEFKALHREVTAHLKAYLPNSVWARLAQTPSQTSAERLAADGPKLAATDEPRDAEAKGADVPVPLAQTSTPAAEQEDWFRYTLAQKDAPDMRFTGKLLDAVRTPVLHGRWTELHVYQTKAGKFIGAKVGRSLLLNEVDRCETHVVEHLADLNLFFGHGPLAKHLTDRLGIRQFVEID